MHWLHDIVPEEATIRIINPSSGTLGFMPEKLQRPYWVSVGSKESFDDSFNTMEEAIQYIKEKSVLNP